MYFNEKSRMRCSKKLITTLLPTSLALMGMLLVSCGTTSPSQSTGTKASPDKQVLNMALQTKVSDIKTFDPALSTDAPSIAAIDLVYTGLVQLNDKLAVVPQLAASYSEGSDGLTWTFKLKPNLKFSDGTPLTSQDVVYSIDRALSPQIDRKSTRLNSSHTVISYAVFCLKKKKKSKRNNHIRRIS